MTPTQDRHRGGNDWRSLWPRVEAAIMARQPAGFTPPVPNANGWLVYHSPLRDDDEHPSFCVRPDTNGPGGFIDHGTGDRGSMSDLARRLDIDPRMRGRDGGSPRDGHRTPSALATLAGFCQARQLDAARLRDAWGVQQVHRSGRAALCYPTTLGVDRIKYLDGGRPKYAWAARGGAAHWYDLGRALELSLELEGGVPLRDTLHVFNGEPAVWAAWQSAVPAVCLCAGEGAVPSAELVDELRRLMSAGRWARVRVVYDVGEEHDKPARGSRAVAAALRAGGIDAAAYGLPADLGRGGDVDDLHRRVGDAGLAAALDALQPLTDDAPEAGAKSAPRAVTVCLADVAPEKIRWLWPGRIPLGKLTVLAGDPGCGKSFITADLAARLSIGAPLPGDTAAPPTTPTLFLAAEDDPGTIRARVERLGGDPTYTHALTAIRDTGEERLPRLDRDLGELEREIARTGARLVVVDPINNYMGSTTSGNNDIAVRAILTPLAALAARTGVALVAMTHLNKNEEAAVARRVLGSTAYVGVARSVLAVGVDPDRPDRQLLVQIKTNLAARACGLGFSVVDLDGPYTGIVVWDGGPVTTDLYAIFAPRSGAGRRETMGALDEAKTFLRDALATGRRPIRAVSEDARDLGITAATLRRARGALGVTTSRDGFGPGATGYWSLSSDDRTRSNDHGGSSAPMGEHLSHYGGFEQLWEGVAPSADDDAVMAVMEVF